MQTITCIKVTLSALSEDYDGYDDKDLEAIVDATVDIEDTIEETVIEALNSHPDIRVRNLAHRVSSLD
jgi:hypothetical protein